MAYVLDSYCGVYCGACPVLLATRAGTLNEDQQCYGCKSKEPTGFCETCGIKACAISKGYEHCIQCSKLTDCDLMQKFISDQRYPYGQCVLNNMERIQTTGLSNWLEMQDKRWRCKNCNSVHSWYHETCPQCGQAVASYKEDRLMGFLKQI